MKAKMFAQALMDLGSDQDMKATAATFKGLLTAMLPYMEHQTKDKDAEMKKFMEREVGKGIVLFQPQLPTRNPLVERAEKMTLPDDFRQKMAARKKKRV